MDRDSLPPTAINDTVFFSILFHLGTMAVAFAIVAGMAGVRGHTALVETFTPAAGLPGLLATAFGGVRNALVDPLGSLAAGENVGWFASQRRIGSSLAARCTVVSHCDIEIDECLSDDVAVV